MKKILVVDDEPDVNLTLKVTLEDKGFTVDTFDDPLFALQNFRAGRSYDLLILDVKMPKMNGFELYREMRKINDKVKVCFLTAGEMYYDDIYSDIFDGKNQFIRKPIENEELIKRVNEILMAAEQAG
ncbi:MAG TPA: response regulator [Nitrososphaeraceae archaeon]|nr:response regulator [Nitrososphaeraceae archaeon]